MHPATAPATRAFRQAFADSLDPANLDHLTVRGRERQRRILETARAFYEDTPMVDTFTNCASGIATSNPGVVAAMDAWNWKANGPDVGDASQVTGSSIFGPAIQAAQNSAQLTTVMVGINQETGFIIGSTFGFGAMFDTLGRSPVQGGGFELVSVGIDVSANLNLAAGAFDPRIVGGSTSFIATVAGVNAGIGASVIIFQAWSGEVYGFCVGLGFGAGVDVSVAFGHFFTI